MKIIIIYHLVGPGALHHLGSILTIEVLEALQFVSGAYNERVHR